MAYSVFSFLLVLLAAFACASGTPHFQHPAAYFPPAALPQEACASLLGMHCPRRLAFRFFL